MPSCTSRVASTPARLSSTDSITIPEAGPSDLARRSSTSATSEIISSRSSTPLPVLALISTAMVSPPYSSGTRSTCIRSRLTRSGSACARSTLLIATMMGTAAALACAIASRVCGMMLSSAATTITAMSVALAPRCRMVVNASWPGVSRKVTIPCLVSAW